MTDKINELTALIESLEADSPLRESLKKALTAELERLAKVAENQADDWQEKARTAEAQRLEEQAAGEADNKAEDKATETADEEEEEQEMTDGTSSSLRSSSDILEGFTDKLDELLEDDEFIAASAGFLLGALTIGAGALAISALKK